ncbi:MAG TPA: 50S ribosomal protein L19 [Candidatus Marinimicrobia bacterium]|jgi:large subunit ribosomal protein L19|nr:50S ribosomal protein L19 [Candidatus Neomarinimicrobiota bacterium]
MANLMQKFENTQIERLVSKKRIPAFRPGDTIKVTLKIVEGERSRLQIYEGICIAKKNNSVNSKFTVRKISHGEGVERSFPLFSPNIDKIEVVRKGDVNRAKLYYLRDRTGKRARIADSSRRDEVDQYALSETIEEEVKISAEPTTENDQSKPEEVVSKTSQKSIAEEAPSVEEKSESTASEAENTEDETKL